MNRNPTADKSSTPPRFVMAVAETDWVAWRVVLRRNDVALVRCLALAGSVLTSDHIDGWFSDCAKRWSKPQRGQFFEDFLIALNVLRVTQSKSVRDWQMMTPERAAMAKRLEMVRDAIATLAHELPQLLAAATSKPTVAFTDDQLMHLDGLAQAAKGAQGVITAPAPPHKETVWHESAKLIEWHLCRLLAQAGVEKVGDDWNGPLVKLILVALTFVEDDAAMVTEAAIAKVLDRAKKDGVRPFPAGSIERMGYLVIA